MRWNDVYLHASAVWLGDPVTVTEAVAMNRYDPDEARTDGFCAVRTAEHTAPAEMAVYAGMLALDRARVPVDDFCLLLHASGSYQGLDHWWPASYIQHHTVGGTASALDIQQACNGGISALALAAGYLSADRSDSAALITTADRYILPDFDRYRADRGQPRGDGATGLVLSRRKGGVARLVSTVLAGDATYEGLQRGDLAWAACRGTHGRPTDLRARAKQYLAGS
ncbi:ketoacyl-ACP synthase III family protein, partial [Streptomyces sp. NPDC001130]